MPARPLTHAGPTLTSDCWGKFPHSCAGRLEREVECFRSTGRVRLFSGRQSCPGPHGAGGASVVNVLNACSTTHASGCVNFASIFKKRGKWLQVTHQGASETGWHPGPGCGIAPRV